jgi:hypothetical protein
MSNLVLNHVNKWIEETKPDIGIEDLIMLRTKLKDQNDMIEYLKINFDNEKIRNDSLKKRIEDLKVMIQLKNSAYEDQKQANKLLKEVIDQTKSKEAK